MAEPKISSNMKKGIKACEEILGINYHGKTFDDAKNFLDENLPKIKDKDIREYRKPSEKQMNAIAIIQKKTGDQFSGKTLKDAAEYIDKHYDEVFGTYKSSSKKRRKK